MGIVCAARRIAGCSANAATCLLEAMLARMPVQTRLSPAATQARDAVRALLRKR
jgi:hypothetical protein